MTRRDRSPLRDDILGEASRWFVELNENPQDEAIRRAFDRWLRRSPEHLHAFLRIAVHWEESAPRPGAPVESVDQLVALAKSDRNVVDLGRERAGAARDDGTVTHAAVRGFRARRVAIAASLLLSLAAALVWQQLFRGVYGTGIGEQRSLTLADGSTVELNSRSRIRVRYTPRERHIDLLEGQALFHVAKNESQPFVVQTRNTQVRAVGTQFDVYRKDTGIVVTVVEGRVAIVPVPRRGPDDDATPVHAENPGAISYLDGGQQLTLGLDSATTAAPARLEPSGIEAATAWTRHRLVFKGTPLSEVIREFNRYSTRPIVISDAAMGAIPISGSFSSSDPSDLLRFLKEVGAYQVRETPTSIEIYMSPH